MRVLSLFGRFRFQQQPLAVEDVYTRPAHNYEERGMRVLILKPAVDTKGGDKLVSRLGVERTVDITVTPGLDPLELVRRDIARHGPLACVLTDERCV